MPANPRPDAISLLRRVASSILDDLSSGERVRLRASVLTGGRGFADADFEGSNSDLTPADVVALMAALDALEGVLKAPGGTPTPHLVALAKFAENPTFRP